MKGSSPSDDLGGEPVTAFRSRPAPSGAGLDDERRTAELIADMTRLFGSAARITARGRAAFADPDDDTQRLATEAILIRLAEIAARLPDAVRDAHPEAPWKALRAVRNRVSHDYRSVDPGIIWAVLVDRLPDFRRELGI